MIKNNKVGRRRRPIYENEVYINLLEQVFLGNNYINRLSESLGKSSSTTFKQLNFLVDQKILKSHIEGDNKVFPFEKKIYTLTPKGKLYLDTAKKIQKIIQESGINEKIEEVIKEIKK